MITPNPAATAAPSTRTGRPRNIRNSAERIIGTAGVSALAEADLFIVSGNLVREFAILLDQSKASEDTKPE